MLEKVNERLAEYERTLAYLQGQTAAGGHQLLTRERRRQISQLETKINDMKKTLAAFEQKFCDDFPAPPPLKEKESPSPKSKTAPPAGGASQPRVLGCLIFLLVTVVLTFLAIVFLYNQNVTGP